MKRLIVCYFISAIYSLTLFSQQKEVKIRLIQTSDIHANFFPFDFITQKTSDGSLAHIYSLIKHRRAEFKDNLILIDNGDILQGQPSAYYYNYIDTISTHLCADMMNYMGYNIGNVGNHDIEVGKDRKSVV